MKATFSNHKIVSTKEEESLIIYSTYSRIITKDLLKFSNLNKINEKYILSQIEIINIIKDLCDAIYENKDNFFEEEIINKSVISIIHIRSYINIIENSTKLLQEIFLEYCDNVLYQWMIIYDIIREFSKNSGNSAIMKKYAIIPAFIRKSFKIDGGTCTLGYIQVIFR